MTKIYDEIRENYGIIKCGKNMFESLNEDDVIAFRREAHSYSVLVNNKQQIKQSIKNLIVENASLEDIMLFTMKGEKI